MVKAIALTFAAGIFKAEQRKAPLPQNFIQAHIVMLVKMLPLKLVRAATGNDLQNKAKRTTRLVSYLTSKMSVHTPKMLALKGQVHKDHKEQKSFASAMELCPASQCEQHNPCMPRKNNHSTSLFPKRANGPLELAGWREQKRVFQVSYEIIKLMTWKAQFLSQESKTVLLL